MAVQSMHKDPARKLQLVTFPAGRKAARELYLARVTGPDQAVQLIQSGHNVVLPMGCGEPLALVEALTRRAAQLQDVKIHQMLPLRRPPYLKPELAGHLRHVSWFNSEGNRQAVNEGWADYMPGYFYEYPRLMQEYLNIDVFMAMVSPMDERGYFSLGTSVDYSSTAAGLARIIILEVNEYMPRTRGNSLIHISQVDCLVENNCPLLELPVPRVSAVERSIAGYAAALVDDGSTIQLGLGRITHAVALALQDKKDLGIHSEMLTEGMVDLVNSGAVNNRKKTLHPGKLIGCFAAGTRRLYDFIHDTPMVELYPVSYTNDPYIIGQNYKMVAINEALEVDLLGQCASESLGHYQYSGTGGQTDFARGALRSPGGKGIIVLRSTARNGTVSKIVPVLKPGAVVSCSRNDVDYVVTEYGVAKLRGKVARERALAMISIAHPDFREDLRRAARKMHLI
ncbi:MAG: acetyl-CoA hydrolase/transferase family protein [Desulfurispora sp.]|uniref:acetyl-CoA hydrolase/transferase family protein n=1 Tax=Desulfurispora sp. TaxID=3014275 RepID=UPI0040498545